MKVTDLSHPFTITDKVFPGTQLMHQDRTHTCESEGYNLTMCTINSHAGTHTDAPLHFLADGKCLAEVDINRYVGPCFIVDCTAKGEPNSMVEVEDVKPYEEQIKKAGRLCLATGWNRMFNTEEFFTQYPSVSVELCQYLADLGVKMIGVEGPSVNTVAGPEAHKILLGADIAIVEALTNMQDLMNREVLFCGAPLAYTGMDGFPLRAYAIEI